MSGYYLGIDGGQSSTRALILGSDGQVYGNATVGPVPHILADGGRERLVSVLRSAIGGVMGDRPVAIRSAFLGLSGVVPGGRLEEAVRASLDLVDGPDGRLAGAQVFVDNDGVAAWAGALGLQPGIIAVAGTGSLVLGFDAAGRSARAGGWGYLFGDEPGAFGIAREAIRRALADLDRGRSGTVLSEAIVSHFAGCPLGDIPRAVYNGDFDRAHVARLLPRLVALAGFGSTEVREVFAVAATTLAGHLRAVAERLSWPSGQVHWAPVGGVFDSGSVFCDPLDAALGTDPIYSFVRVAPLAEPVVGAAWLAADRVGDRLSADAIRHLRSRDSL